ncbi:adenine-specific DNA methylase [bacterium]|nr:adenine-specific DNA methylase [bacterium]
MSELAELESWRKEIYRPIYHIHKWWAKRLGSVFRAILLGSALDDRISLGKVFYRQHDFGKLVVFDPFMGSGTTIGEAHKLGCVALGRDINPVAYESVRVALGPLDRETLLQAYRTLSVGVGERLRRLYLTTGRDGQPCDVLYYFWVKTVPCPQCAKPVDLFSSYVFARNAYPDRKPEGRVYCPQCSDVFAASVHQTEVSCPHCRFRYDPHRGPAAGVSATCRSCNHSFPIAKTVQSGGRPPAHRLYAKLVLTSSGEKSYLRTGPEDDEAYRRCSEELARSALPLPTLALSAGYNTNQALNYAYRSWRDFFNDRQLLALGLLHQAILELPDSPARDAMLTVFSGALEFNNVFASYKGEGTGAIRHMFSHHILKPERMPIEGNVWGTPKSSGSFSTLFKSRLLRAVEYQQAPFEVAVNEGGKGSGGRKVYGSSAPLTGGVSTAWPPPGSPSARSIHLSCGASDATDLPDASVDLVVTDPPFFDNVHYSELADFFYAWQQLRPVALSPDQATTRHPSEVQDTDAEAFAQKLQAVFKECCRVLKDDGLLVFTYHHSRMEGWSSLVEAVLGAGFTFVNAHPVKAEMSVAAPKSQAKEPIQFDIVMVCRKQTADKRPSLEPDVAFERAVERARQKAARLTSKGFQFSANDKRVVFISQFIAEASAGRSAAELRTLLDDHGPALELAATEAVEPAEPAHSGSNRRAHQAPPDRQLVLLEHRAPWNPAKPRKKA